ncbi:sulfotransferase, partial [uncultured Shimia sp.]|uniref:sulfotransferase n=1 Tax=uncultured Shimia sp. TaxID=573152 RepID=UPI00262BFE38
FSRLFAILSPPFPNLNGGPIQMGRLTGGDLIVANEHNQAGYFEDNEVVNLHNRIMSASGADWTTPLSTKVGVLETDLERIKKYIKRRSKNSRLWCVKDPRLTRFLHEWKAVAPELKFVIVYRNPAASVFSLQRRQMQFLARSGGTEAESLQFFQNSDLGAILWRDHNEALLKFAEQYPDDCIVIGHKALIQGANLVPLLSEKFSLNLPLNGSGSPTVDNNLVTKNVPVLNLKDPALMNDIKRIWSGLLNIDVVRPEAEDDTSIDNLLNLDPNGVNAELQLLGMQAMEANRDIQSRARLREVSFKLAQKLKKPPFS